MSGRIARALVIGSLTLGPAFVSATGAQTSPPPSQTPPSQKPGASTAAMSSDVEFIKKAAEGGMKEVEVGKLAQSRASDSNVKAFADRMVKDHGAANTELMSLAKSKGVMLPPSPDRRSTTADAAKPESGATGTSGQRPDPLESLKGAEFDRAYMTKMVEDHEKTVQLFEQEANSGKDAEVKAWAAKTLPTLREHLSQARSVRDRLSPSK
jgi:putative membrane protein